MMAINDGLMFRTCPKTLILILRTLQELDFGLGIGGCRLLGSGVWSLRAWCLE